MTKMKLKKIGSMSAAKIGGALYGIIGLFIALAMFVVGMATIVSGNAQNGVIMIVIGVVAAIFYCLIGAVTIAICAILFNLITKFTGGLEIETE